MDRVKLLFIWILNSFAWLSDMDEILKIVSLLAAIALTFGQMVIHRKKFFEAMKELLQEIQMFFRRKFAALRRVFKRKDKG